MIFVCEHVCVCVMNLWVCQNVCAYFSVFQVFCIGYIIFEIEKKKKPHRLTTLLLQVTEFVWSPFPQSLASLHWNALDDSWGTAAWWPYPPASSQLHWNLSSQHLTTQLRALRGPQPPGLKDAGLVQQGARQNDLTQGGQRWCLVPQCPSLHIVVILLSAACLHPWAALRTQWQWGWRGLSTLHRQGWEVIATLLYFLSQADRRWPCNPQPRKQQMVQTLWVTNLSTLVAMAPGNAETAAASAALPGRLQVLAWLGASA